MVKKRFKVTNATPINGVRASLVSSLKAAIRKVLETNLNTPYFDGLSEKARYNAALEWVEEV
jgi:hypothetical protein